MGVTIIAGAQYGDEGKGRVVDELSSRFDYNVRYQGGDNAGHTVTFGNKEYIVHLIPSGIFHASVITILGSGMVVNPESILKEMQMLNDAGFSTENMLISRDANVLLPFHQVLDEMRERQENRIGTTKKGVGFAYADVMTREALKFFDLLDERSFYEKLSEQIATKKKILAGLYNWEGDLGYIVDSARQWRERLLPHVTDTKTLLKNAINAGKNVLFEGQLGTMRDINLGVYPYVTSSTTVPAGVSIYEGIPPDKFENIVGVVKTYETCVGSGPFVTEIFGHVAEHIKQIANEYGATTKRPRRIGGLDMLALKYSVDAAGFNKLALTHLDILDQFHEIPVCVAYEIDGNRVDEFTPNRALLEKANPVYEHIPGWKSSTRGMTDASKLPSQARYFVDFIQSSTNRPVHMITTGPSRGETIYMK